MRIPTTLAMSFALLCSTAIAQTTWYVNQVNCPGPGNGTAGNPFCSIQDGIVAAAPGDTVLVAPGVYQENLDFLGKAITVRSSEGAAATTIDANFAGSAVVFANGEGPTSVIEGFTMTNGTGTVFTSSAEGGGVACRSTSPTIRGNIMINNSPHVGGGISCRSGASPLILDNIIASNQAPGAGGGVYCNTNCAPLLVNNIIYGNTVTSATGGALYLGYTSDAILVNNTMSGNTALNFGGMFAYQSNPTITNSIFWRNAPNELNTGTITYCVVAGGFAGTGNLNSDPLFADPANGDYHLQAGSPCAGAGDNNIANLPATDFEGDPRTAGGTADIGADEFHLHLYTIGTAAAWAPIDVKFVGQPGTNPVYLLIGSGLLDPPLPIPPFGDFYLLPPFWDLGLPQIPPSGILTLTATLAAPAPFTLYLQALIGTELTNPHTLIVP